MIVFCQIQVLLELYFRICMTSNFWFLSLSLSLSQLIILVRVLLPWRFHHFFIPRYALSHLQNMNLKFHFKLRHFLPNSHPFSISKHYYWHWITITISFPYFFVNLPNSWIYQNRNHDFFFGWGVKVPFDQWRRQSDRTRNKK